jgi:hypothetical protein
MLQQFETVFDSVVAFAQKRSLNEVNYEAVQEVFMAVTGQGREYQKQFLQLMLRMLRNVLMQNTNNPGMLKVTHREQAVINKYRGILHLKQISTMTELCNQAVYHIARNGNSSLIFTDLYFQLVKSF